jgi:UDP-N-acetylglucosamine acyltransferase
MPDVIAAASTRISPSATVDPTASIGEGVVIEADAYVGPNCVVGDRCRLRRRSMLVANTTLGARCDVHPNAVLGGDPQDSKYDPATPGALVIGDGGVFREGVTVHRSVGDRSPTTIGAGCFFMANSHAGHNTLVGDNVTLANGVLLAGHVRLGSRCFMGGNSGVHQFCDIGEGVMFQGVAIATMHVLPFTIISGVNNCSGINVVGLRRLEGVSREDITEVRLIYKSLLREGHAVGSALERLESRPWGPFARRMLDFAHHVRRYEKPRVRGLAASRSQSPLP